MSGDGQKTFKPRKRSLRNKIVSAFLAVPAAVTAAEKIPGAPIPPGTGEFLFQLGGLVALLANVTVQK